MIKAIAFIDELLDRFSRFGLIGCLALILGLSVAGIVFRWFGTSLMWIDPLVRHLVFLSAFMGGSVATSKQVHIRVDLLTKIVEMSRSKIIHWVHRNLISLFGFLVCLGLMKSGWDFFLVEKEFGATGFLEIHSAVWVFIIPFGMGLITLRFLNQLLIGLFVEESREPHRL